MMGMQSPSLARCEIHSGANVCSSNSTLSQLNELSHKFIHTVNNCAFPVGTVPRLKDRIWSRRSKAEDVLGILSKHSPSCSFHQAEQTQGRLLHSRRQIQEVNLNGISSQYVTSQEASDVDDEQAWPADDEISFFSDVQNQPSKRKKRGSLGVRKPLPEAEKADFATRFGLTAHHSQSSQIEEASDFEYYVPKVGDEVMGVIVSGNDYKLDVDVGAQQLGRMLTKDVYPVDLFRSDELFWEMNAVEGGATQDFPVGRFRLVRDEEVFCLPAARAPIVEVGTVLRLKVQGVTLSGRPILSSRKVSIPVAWERVRQIKKQNEPFEVQILEWNSGGVLTKIEGLRAFLPLNQFLKRSMGTGALKSRVGERVQVLITEVDEESGKLIISEKRAWGWKNLGPGSLHDGIVNKIFPFGVEVSLTGTSLRGMVHISNVSRSRVKDLEEIFSVNEEVKVMVVKSPIPHRIALSTADLESSKGLILEDKQRVFSEAAEMASRYRSSLTEVDQEEDNISEVEMIENEIANRDWLHFGEETDSGELGQPNNEQ
ncbi:small subunit ribosomal protein S1 [Marchantia polymorpha subsp. ruderalis]|uniref:S1 motif domain-containing protein n=2 Tax=Marchantia polymorpha TaxID=3197 RepID=A0AAF6AMR1_MARPO|nr:hypothetical protein MARPO_0036s0031 [Marchantia polymorpha]PTQ41035.1 hypothetical protein MARPO_0036s0031 [Marchantia polymorpha]BBM97730.1 hypothetical protein Mp_1g07870 [Marchantia polymorpha subsp. ruderalis]BBM97731.1 hypothetical protein Mp_1g07870 [Marchantia polymorpha subsp. ruderalis]|eukprot:PTQ41034.1 hypothetical protein MARPO_0036s0031 [Marchantia polymorpha]